MPVVRFFIANLPSYTKEEELRDKFAPFGSVKNVEIKVPKAADNSNIKIIAFVTAEVDDADNCIYELNGQRINGFEIKVSVAKESFLDRLKREREANTKEEKDDSEQNNNITQPSELLNTNRNRKIKFSEDQVIEVDEGLLITKKRASSSLQNGKIVIESVQNEPLHTIQNRKTQENNKNLSEKALQADLKRKQSLKNLAEQYNKKKSAVQIALRAVDSQPAKKIKFSDEQTKLFSSDDENDTDELNVDFNADKKYIGQQTEVSDKRFHLGKAFLDNKEKAESVPKADKEEDDERKWQIGILEQVVGQQIDHMNPADGKGGSKKVMLRYDPSKKNQQKYFRSDDADHNETLEGNLNTEPLDLYDNENQTKHDIVSKEMFYTVSDTLAAALQKQTESSFSLLNMFGQLKEDVNKERHDLIEKMAEEKIIVSNADWNSANPFTYDSSDTENEEETAETTKRRKKSEKVNKKNDMIYENFFFDKTDTRLEGNLIFMKLIVILFK